MNDLDHCNDLTPNPCTIRKWVISYSSGNKLLFVNEWVLSILRNALEKKKAIMLLTIGSHLMRAAQYEWTWYQEWIDDDFLFKQLKMSDLLHESIRTLEDLYLHFWKVVQVPRQWDIVFFSMDGKTISNIGIMTNRDEYVYCERGRLYQIGFSGEKIMTSIENTLEWERIFSRNPVCIKRPMVLVDGTKTPKTPNGLFVW